MFSVPCGCRGELNSRSEPQSFTSECPIAQEIFSRLMRDPNASERGNPITAELQQHIAEQL
jgi:hypothetical protein